MIYFVKATHWKFKTVEELIDYDNYPKVTKFFRKYTKLGYTVEIDLRNNKEKLNWF